MMTNRSFYRLAALAFAFTMATVCYAQTDTARLQGTVTDPNGAALVGAEITVTDLGTQRVVTADTNDQGFYVVPALPPGHYRAEVAQKGFQKSVRDFELQISQVAVVDFSLQVGSSPKRSLSRAAPR